MNRSKSSVDLIEIRKHPFAKCLTSKPVNFDVICICNVAYQYCLPMVVMTVKAYSMDPRNVQLSTSVPPSSGDIPRSYSGNRSPRKAFSCSRLTHDSAANALIYILKGTFGKSTEKDYGHKKTEKCPEFSNMKVYLTGRRVFPFRAY